MLVIVILGRSVTSAHLLPSPLHTSCRLGLNGQMLARPAAPGTEQIAVHDPLQEHPAEDSYRPLAVQRVYDGMAADYAVRFGSELADADQSDADIQFLDSAVRSFPDGCVIDVGCGPAQVSRYLIERGLTVGGVDFAIAMLA